LPSLSLSSLLYSLFIKSIPHTVLQCSPGYSRVKNALRTFCSLVKGPIVCHVPCVAVARRMRAS
jgi:hypothetical protein